MVYLLTDATEACRGQSPGTTLTLDGGLPTAAINSPNFPGRYPDNRLCYYKVTSPAASRIILEFLERLALIDLEDFIYIYDISNPSEVSLLRIISAGPFSEYSFIETESNMIQIVFESRPGSGSRGFFIRASYQGKYESNIICVIFIFVISLKREKRIKKKWNKSASWGLFFLPTLF